MGEGKNVCNVFALLMKSVFGIYVVTTSTDVSYLIYSDNNKTRRNSSKSQHYPLDNTSYCLLYFPLKVCVKFYVTNSINKVLDTFSFPLKTTTYFNVR